jgi:hypothetical protein
MDLIRGSDLEHRLNENVELIGLAQNAKCGAIVVLSDSTPIYIDKMDSWGTQWTNKRIMVTGKLGRRNLTPNAVSKDGEKSAELSGPVFYIASASWKEP